MKPASNRRLYKGLGRESFVSATSTRNPSAFAALERAAPGIPYLVLHPMGFSVPCRLRSRGALLPHLFTITTPRLAGTQAGCLFSVALSVRKPHGILPACISIVRT